MRSLILPLVTCGSTEERADAAGSMDDGFAGQSVGIGMGGFPPALWGMGGWPVPGGMSGMMGMATGFSWPDQERDPAERAEASATRGS